MLNIGDMVQESDGSWQAVLSSSREDYSDGVTVYNFEVEGDHTYFVSDGVGAEDAVWVHNTCVGEIPHTVPGLGNIGFGRSAFSKRLARLGYVADRPASGGQGIVFQNPDTGAEVRIHPKPGFSDDPAKMAGNWYYRYRTGPDKGWSEIAVPLE